MEWLIFFVLIVRAVLQTFRFWKSSGLGELFGFLVRSTEPVVPRPGQTIEEFFRSGRRDHRYENEKVNWKQEGF